MAKRIRDMGDDRRIVLSFQYACGLKQFDEWAPLEKPRRQLQNVFVSVDSSFFVAGGVVPPGSASYVERTASRHTVDVSPIPGKKFVRFFLSC